MKVKATIVKVGDIQSGVSATTGRPWKRREVIVSIDDNDPEIAGQVRHQLQVTFNGDVCDEFNSLAPGAVVGMTLGFSLRSYNNREFQQVNGWGVSPKSPLTPEGGEPLLTSPKGRDSNTSSAQEGGYIGF